MTGVRIDVRSDIDRVVSQFTVLRRDQLPFALALAVTRTGQLVKKAVEYEMPMAFDRPTPYTLGSVFLKAATKAIPVATVWLKDDASKGTPASKYLYPEIAGGGRGLKRFEKRLQMMGLLPSGMYAVPGSAAKLDAYGNISAGQIEQILSALGAAEIFSGYQANRTKASAKRKGAALKEYFVGRPGGHAPLGIYQRVKLGRGSAVKPIMIFVRQPIYHERYRFQEIAARVVSEEFPRQFSDAYRVAVQTAGFKP